MGDAIAGSPPPHTASGELLHENVEAMEVLVGIRLQPQGPRRPPGGIPLGCGVGPSVFPLGGGSHRSDGSHPNNIMTYLLLCFQVVFSFSFQLGVFQIRGKAAFFWLMYTEGLHELAFNASFILKICRRHSLGVQILLPPNPLNRLTAAVCSLTPCRRPV